MVKFVRPYLTYFKAYQDLHRWRFDPGSRQRLHHHHRALLLIGASLLPRQPSIGATPKRTKGTKGSGMKQFNPFFWLDHSY